MPLLACSTIMARAAASGTETERAGRPNPDVEMHPSLEGLGVRNVLRPKTTEQIAGERPYSAAKGGTRSYSSAPKASHKGAGLRDVPGQPMVGRKLY